MVNYIIGTYFGQRRMEEMNGLELCELHFKQLLKLKHNINKIYVVVPRKEFNPQIYKTIEKYPSLSIEVMINENNEGFAFGSWDICLKKTIGEVKFSLITEDDYIPIIDNFDKIFLDEFIDDKVAYVCQLLTCESGPYRGYGVELAQGIIRHSAFKESGGFNIGGYGYYEVVEESQAVMLKNIIERGYIVKDMIDKYRAFYDRNSKIKLYGKKSDPEIFRPIECILHNCDEYIEQCALPYINDYKILEELNLSQINAKNI